MVDFLTSVDSDNGPREPIPVTIVSAGAEVSLGGGGSSDPAVATRLGDTSNPATGTVNQRLALINSTLGSPLQAGGNVVATITGTPSVTIANASLPVTGTFFQATQPISATALPLPSGAATSALQTSMGTTLTSLDGKAGPSTATTAAITPTVGQGVTSLQLKSSAGNFYSASVTAGATAGFLIAYNSATVPASGAALTAALVLNAVAVGASGLAGLGGNPVPDRFSTGIVLLFSTSLATYTIPANPAAFMRGSAV